MEEILEVIQLLYTDEEVDREREEEIHDVIRLLYADEKVDRRLERLSDGISDGTSRFQGKRKGLRFSP
jgi:ABC-type cobalamin transport system ATPase subunit